MIPEPNFPARPDEFVGRNGQVQAFHQVLAQGLLTGRTPSFAVLGDWGLGKSSLLLKYFAICSGPEYAMLPVFFSVSTELSDYKRFAEGLLDTFTRALETSGSLETRLRTELQKWKLNCSWVYSHLKELPAIRLGRYVRFRRSAIERFLEQRVGACE